MVGLQNHRLAGKTLHKFYWKLIECEIKSVNNSKNLEERKDESVM